MSVATRVGQLERDRFDAACHQFRPWFLDHLRDPVIERQTDAWAEAAGMPVNGTQTEIRAWFAAQPQTPWDDAVDPVIELLMEHPNDHAAIRAALARVAPYVGRCAGDPPLTILTSLRAGFLGPRARVAAYRRERGHAQR